MDIKRHRLQPVPSLIYLADILNGLMAIPNVLAVLLLSGLIAKETKKYKGKHIDDIDPEEPPVVKNSKKGVLG